MKALTIRQPWASLIAAGVKTIETRSWSTKHRGPIAIHAGMRLYTAEDKHADRGLFLRAHDALDLERNNGVYDLPYGAIVATANLVDCAPIGGPFDFRTGCCEGDDGDHPGQSVVVLHPPLSGEDLWTLVHDADGRQHDITEQLPLGDYAPGRWAWLLDDIKPTTERCPWCLGHGVGPDQSWDDSPTDGIICCPACDGTGHCDPIPAKGRQGLWEWTP